MISALALEIPDWYASSLSERMWKYTSPEPTCGCWLWFGAADELGYGRVWVVDKLQLAYRASYALSNGPIPAGLVLDHLCRTPQCVNPRHLEVVTQKLNAQRGETGAHYSNRTHCAYGHPFSGDNLIMQKDRRACRTCQNQANVEYRKRKKEKNGNSINIAA